MTLLKTAIGSLVLALSLSHSVYAAPSVLVDISPTHSLVAMVMGNLGEPGLLISSATNPHDFAMRPSDADRISKADLLIYTSETLTPWLVKALKSLAKKTPTIELISTQGTTLLPMREDHLFNHDEHEHHGEGDGDVHDPHAWLDPANAIVWLDHIANELSRLDNDNALVYRENAKLASQKIQATMEHIEKELSGLHSVPYLVFHDSYQYFEARFNLRPQASISLGDGTKPGISQIRRLQKVLVESQARCVFSEPQFSDRLVNTVVSGLSINTTTLDPLGANLEIGDKLYLGLLSQLSSSLADCLSMK